MCQHLNRPIEITRIIRKWKATQLQPNARGFAQLMEYLGRLEVLVEMYLGFDAQDGTLADDPLNYATDVGLVKD